jgi:arylsulfatase A-like enzyme/Tfp pilus assembly protein PilF
MTGMKKALLFAIAAGVVAGAAAGIWLWRGSARDTAVPTGGPIILISIDTLRADRLPAYGYDAIETPHIDGLAADGVLFERAWSHAPLTLPAHMSMLTGELPFEHGVRDNIGFKAKPDQRFVQHALGDLGYATGGFISSYVLRRQTGIHEGFSHYDDTLPPAAPDSPLGSVQRAGADTVAAAITWIDQQKSPKFFAFVHIYEPHLPYTPPERFAGGDAYDGEVAWSDEIIGGLLSHLRAKGLYDDATIVLLSDHGEGLGDHGEDEHGIFLYRETIQVPLIVKLPGSLRAGARVGAAVQHLDLAPTLLALAGGSAVRGSGVREFAGRALRPVLDGTGDLPDASIYSESLSPRYHFGWSELYALADDRYRLIRAPRDELYDLAQDPGERQSLVDERPQVHAAMRGALDAMIASGGVTAPSAVSDEDRGKLAALGYVGTQRGALAERDSDSLPDPKDKVDVLRQYRRATRLAGEGRVDEAIAEYRALLAADPEMTDVWLQLAALYERRGRHAQALEAYRAIVARDPKDPAGLTGAASALVHLGRLDEARAHAELAVDVAPAVAREMLARIALNARNFPEARRQAALAEQADPTLPMTAAVEGAVRYAEGNYAGAVEPLREAARGMAARTEQLPDVSYYLADALARLERYGEAEPFFLAEIRHFPNNLRARAGLAMLYRAMGRVEASDHVVGELVRVAPTPEGYGLAADLWSMFGDPRRAEAMRARARGATR